MKKLLQILLIGIGLIIVFSPLLVGAQEMIKTCELRHDLTDMDPNCTEGATVCYSEEDCPPGTPVAPQCCIMDAILTATDWIFAIVLAIAIIFIIWGAFTLVTAGGSPEKALKGRNYIIYAVVGFIVALLAKAIPAIAAWFLGG